MEDLLLLIHRIPYPPNKGDKIRSYNRLKPRGRTYRLHRVTFGADPADGRQVPRVVARGASVHFAALNRRLPRVSSKDLGLGKEGGPGGRRYH